MGSRKYQEVDNCVRDRMGNRKLIMSAEIKKIDSSHQKDVINMSQCNHTLKKIRIEVKFASTSLYFHYKDIKMNRTYRGYLEGGYTCYRY